MAYGLNKVQLIGRLGGDPELKHTESNIPVVNFSLATNESYKDQEGNLVERVEWHRCVAWRKLAELLHQFLKKGSRVYLEGKLQTRSWEDKDGNKRYTTEVLVDEFVFLDSNGANKTDNGDPGGSSNSAPPDDLPF
ncbi:MAG TPA: single-stranded DNA-binding protein [Bacteroidota bacterium]|nr:single-stranded DNA-binding protein [Bacteroidota bacterium]